MIRLGLPKDAKAVYNGPHSVDTPNRQLGHFLR